MLIFLYYLVNGNRHQERQFSSFHIRYFLFTLEISWKDRAPLTGTNLDVKVLELTFDETLLSLTRTVQS